MVGEQEGESGPVDLQFYDLDVLGVWVSIGAGGPVKAESRKLTLTLYNAGNETVGSSEKWCPMNDVAAGEHGLDSIQLPEAHAGEGYVAHLQLEGEEGGGGGVQVGLNRTEDGSWVAV